jgi:dihydroorotate dehydrogenase electron transfer subunit
MSRLGEGDTVDLMGPAGNGFDLDIDGRILLIGGGIGIYPLYSVAARYGKRADVVLGFRTGSLVNFEGAFAAAGAKTHVCTDNGSAGTQGYAIEKARELLDANVYDAVMCCGPAVMMRGVAEEAAGRGIRCQVSLEERMACAVGACLACVCDVKNADGSTGRKRVCADGPVFESSDIVFG